LFRGRVIGGNDVTHQNYTNFAQTPENDNVMLVKPNLPAATLVAEAKKHRALYPEIHYKLKPFISVTCDAIQASGVNPSAEEMDEITDNIYEDFCKVHPEMENYMKAGTESNDTPEAVQTIGFGGRYGYGYGYGYPGFRRRGLGRDLIGSLLLGELTGRGYPYSSCYPYCGGSGSYYPYY
jgi:hypothetical protein